MGGSDARSSLPEIEQDLRGNRPIGGDVEGPVGLTERKTVRDNRLHIQPIHQQLHRGVKFLVEAKCTTQLQLARDDEVSEQAHLSGWQQAEQDHSATPANTLDTGPEPGNRTRGLERDVYGVRP